jgi:thiol-disulfide isomerase/thioredoxin/tetratricopeptide (TPR) repeat protein
MNMQIRLTLWLLVLGVAVCPPFAGSFSAAGATLNIGDPAPPLQTGKWIQGDPVNKFDRGTAYLVDFWAAWSAPCRESIPHVNEIYQKFKDKGLIVIGQNCWEQDEDQAKTFVKQMAAKMTYPVVLDDKTRIMAKTWMAAAGRSGMPTAFIVDKKGQVAWVGNPVELADQMVEAVLLGKLEVKTAATPLPAKSPLAETEAQLNLMIARTGSNSAQSLNELIQRAHVRARSGRWKEASADLKQALHINSSDQWAWYLLSPLLIQTGDISEYQKHSHEVLVRFGQTGSNLIAGRAAEGCLLFPGASTEDLELAAKLAEKKIFPHWRRFYVGLAEYRLGHFSSAADWMEQIRNDLDTINPVDRRPCEADACLVLAMAQHQLKQPDKARAALTHAEEIVETVMPKLDGSDLGRYWWNVLTTRTFMKEAQELIEKHAELVPGTSQ